MHGHSCRGFLLTIGQSGFLAQGNPIGIATKLATTSLRFIKYICPSFTLITDQFHKCLLCPLAIFLHFEFTTLHFIYFSLHTSHYISHSSLNVIKLIQFGAEPVNGRLRSLVHQASSRTQFYSFFPRIYQLFIFHYSHLKIY